MLALILGVVVATGQDLRSTAVAVDVSAIRVGAPVPIAELDLGRMHGELRRLAWSPDGSELYIQTAEPQRGGTDRLHHYLVPAAGGTPAPVGSEPEWAASYWSFKSDRSAPGVSSLMIDVDQKQERIKVGTGSAGAADRTSSGLGAENINTSDNLERAAAGQNANVIRLVLLGEVIGEWINQRPVPGLTFGWGPPGSGAIAFVDPAGRLFLLDREKRKQQVRGAKDALLPAWTNDGTRLAYVTRIGRRKYQLVQCEIAR